MFILNEILQNWLIRFGWIESTARRFHSTGINREPQAVRRVYETYARYAPVVGKDILEIGPGQTLDVLEQARISGARSCTAVDIVEYISTIEAGEKRVRCVVYDGKRLPFDSDHFDVIWSNTAFEHLRYPAVTVKECYRVLRHGGRMVAVIDLGDHSFYGRKDPQPLKLFHCLQYSERTWNLMKWNRSSYTNRLRKSEWKRLFNEAGFLLIEEESKISEEIAQALPTIPYLHRYGYDDAVTSVITVRLEKPRLVHS